MSYEYEYGGGGYGRGSNRRSAKSVSQKYISMYANASDNAERENVLIQTVNAYKRTQTIFNNISEMIISNQKQMNNDADLFFLFNYYEEHEEELWKENKELFEFFFFNTNNLISLTRVC